MGEFPDAVSITAISTKQYFAGFVIPANQTYGDSRGKVMKCKKMLSLILAALMVLSVGTSAAATATGSSAASTAESSSTTQDTDKKNAAIFFKKLKKIMDKDGLNSKNFAFGYYDFSRDFKYMYNADMLFPSLETIKFPLEYVYYDAMLNGKVTLQTKIGADTCENLMLNSLKSDDMSDTNTLISYYGGLSKLKSSMMHYTSNKVKDGFYTSDKVSARYYLDFLKHYYSEAVYCSTDFKTLLIDPIKEISPGKYSERGITQCKVTHRYGTSSSIGAAADVGIANSNYPFGFVIFVSGSQDAEKVVSDVAELAYDYNNDYGSLLIAENTTYSNVPESEKKVYTDTGLNTTQKYAIIGAAALIVVGGTVYLIIRNHKRVKEYRGDE